MARGPEGKFKTKVDDLLPMDIHHQASSAMYSNGTADRYYEGPKQHLWAEYKWWPAKRPKKPIVPLQLCEPLQQIWLQRAAANGQPVVVVVAGPGWVIVTGPKQWSRRWRPSTTEPGSAAMLALMIEDHCRGRIKLHEK
jgi:hypothetical protein